MDSYDFDDDQSSLVATNATLTKFSSKPKNTLDYLALSSETYEQYKFGEMIKKSISQFNFDQKIVEEIISICALYNDKLRMSTLLPVVIFKIIKKYHYPITFSEISAKIPFNKSNYLKYSHIVKIGFSFSQETFNDVANIEINNIFAKLIDLVTNENKIFSVRKSKVSKDNILKLSNQFLSKPNAFIDYKNLVLDELNTVKSSIRELIEANDFGSFFEDKRSIRVLIITLIRLYLAENCQIKINLNSLKNIFRISTNSITKCQNLIKEFISLNNIKL